MAAGRVRIKKAGFNWKMRFLSCLLAGVFLLTSTGISSAFTSLEVIGPLTAGAFVDDDADGDGLGDTWETTHFGNITAQDGNGDPDGDGYNNLWEYKNGTDPNDPGDPDLFLPAKNKAVGFLKAMMDKTVGSGMRILHSYVNAANVSTGYGWTYDNAISAIAFQKLGEWQRSKEILDAYVWLQDNDPHLDGRIRRAYWASIPIDTLQADATTWIIPIGTNSEGFAQAIGDMAFMMIAALNYHEYIGGSDPSYLNFARKLGDWIHANALSTNGAGGYNLVRNNQELANPAAFDRKSTENNVDVYVAFMRLYEADGDHKYRTYALNAKNFVLAMWNAVDGMLWTGTLDDGITINGGTNSDVVGYIPGDPVFGQPTSGQPADPSTWGFLALGEIAKYGTGVLWVEGNCRVNNMDGFAFGYDFNADRDGIWFEGSAHIALAYQKLSNDTMSDSILNIIIQAQDNATGGITCASHNGVTTSFNQWILSTDFHVTPAAWLIFNIEKYNPFWNQPVTDTVPYEGGYNSGGTQYIFNEPWADASVTAVNPAADGTARAMADLSGTGGDDKGTLSVADDGAIVKYEWDFDGKGTYDWSSTTTGNVTYWYTETGSHMAKLRVTNDNGYVSTKGVTITVAQADLGAGFAPPQITTATVSSVSGQALFTASFTGAGTDSDGYVAGYEWDFNGDGEYDSYSDTSGNITHTYNEPGTFQPTFRITDDDGLTDTASLALEVLANPAAPTASVANTLLPTPLTAPYKVNFSANGSVGNISLYQWDFDGNSVYDWSSTTSGNIVHTYGEPGTYTAKLKITSPGGLTDVETVTVRVSHNSLLPAPQAAGSVAPVNGVIPFDAAFTDSTSAGTINTYQWDFEGDKNYDATNGAADSAMHTYTRPGYYLAALKVTGVNGLAHRAYVPVIAAGPNQAGGVFSSYMTTPQGGQRIYGDSVTVSIKIAPQDTGQTASLQQKLTTAGAGAWADVDPSVTYPYRTTINATALGAGDYDLRAPVNGISTNAKVSPIIIDPINWDIHETVNAQGERVKQVRVNKDNDTNVELVNGTTAVIEGGTLSADDTVTMTTPASISDTFVSTGTNTVLYQRDIDLALLTALNKQVTITIPYEDANNDGIVDGLNIPEADLQLLVYNPVTAEWEALSNYTVFTAENYVSGQTGHFSVFGLGGPVGGGGGIASVGGAIGSAFGGGGGGRGCFIATATYGTVMAEEVQSLRDFRDTYLLTNMTGEFVIDMYERYSPPIARGIEQNEFLKGMVRYQLRPLITFARFVNGLKDLKAVMRHD